jgi:hypothetical protein
LTVVGSTFVEHVQDQLPGTTSRAMFGGHGDRAALADWAAAAVAEARSSS